MTSSGTYNFTMQNSGIVLEAFDRIGIRGSGVTSAHMLSARTSLNLALQSWANKGLRLWLVQLVTVPLVANQSVYSVDPKVIDILDVYYSTPLNDGTGQVIDRIMEPISRTDYASYANKQQPGFPTVWWFDRLNSPTVTFWQPPLLGSPDASISYYCMVRAQDANIGGLETPDVNYRFLDALCAELAARLSEKYNPVIEQGMRLKAKMAWDEAAAEDRERVTTWIRPVLTGYWTP